MSAAFSKHLQNNKKMLLPKVVESSEKCVTASGKVLLHAVVLCKFLEVQVMHLWVKRGVDFSCAIIFGLYFFWVKIW